MSYPMVARLLKLFEFQKHLNLTVKTLARSGQDLMHFMLIFLYTIFCSAMLAHLMLGAMNESFATLQVGLAGTDCMLATASNELRFFHSVFF